MKKGIAIALLLMGMFGIQAHAYDFGIRLSNGDSLFFNVTDVQNHYVSVVPPRTGGTTYYYGHRQPSGAVMMPAAVKRHNGD